MYPPVDLDRRTFLQVLGAVGVLTGAPTWLRDLRTLERFGLTEPPDDDDVSEWLGPTDLAVYGREQTFEVTAHNDGPSPGIVELKRLTDDGGTNLLNLYLGSGGICRWVAAPGQELRGPVRLIVPEYVQVTVVGTDNHGRMVAATKDGLVPLYA